MWHLWRVVCYHSQEGVIRRWISTRLLDVFIHRRIPISQWIRIWLLRFCTSLGRNLCISIQSNTCIRACILIILMSRGTSIWVKSIWADDLAFLFLLCCFFYDYFWLSSYISVISIVILHLNFFVYDLWGFINFWFILQGVKWLFIDIFQKPVVF